MGAQLLKTLNSTHFGRLPVPEPSLNLSRSYQGRYVLALWPNGLLMESVKHWRSHNISQICPHSPRQPQPPNVPSTVPLLPGEAVGQSTICRCVYSPQSSATRPLPFSPGLSKSRKVFPLNRQARQPHRQTDCLGFLAPTHSHLPPANMNTVFQDSGV